MYRIAIVIALATLLAACAANPIPEGYTGPLAKIAETSTPRSERSIDFFYLARINGSIIDNSLSATSYRNYGRGFAMEPIVISRDVPAAAATFAIVGRTHYAAPILELTNTVYEVKGDISFTPAANQTYVVRGVLGPEYSAVWIEDAATKSVIGNKIEIKGKATLGVLEK